MDRRTFLRGLMGSASVAAIGAMTKPAPVLAADTRTNLLSSHLLDNAPWTSPSGATLDIDFVANKTYFDGKIGTVTDLLRSHRITASSPEVAERLKAGRGLDVREGEWVIMDLDVPHTRYVQT